MGDADDLYIRWLSDRIDAQTAASVTLADLVAE